MVGWICSINGNMRNVILKIYESDWFILGTLFGILYCLTYIDTDDVSRVSSAPVVRWLIVTTLTVSFPCQYHSTIAPYSSITAPWDERQPWPRSTLSYLRYKARGFISDRKFGWNRGREEDSGMVYFHSKAHRRGVHEKILCLKVLKCLQIIRSNRRQIFHYHSFFFYERCS
jgi:hypothetical protein